MPFYLGIVCLPMLALTDVLQGIARAHSWALAALLPTYITRPVLILAFMAAALALGFPADAATAVLASIAATYAPAGAPAPLHHHSAGACGGFVPPRRYR